MALLAKALSQNIRFAVASYVMVCGMHAFMHHRYSFPHILRIKSISNVQDGCPGLLSLANLAMDCSSKTNVQYSRLLWRLWGCAGLVPVPSHRDGHGVDLFLFKWRLKLYGVLDFLLFNFISCSRRT